MKVEDLHSERMFIVREADLKALIESNNLLAERLERIEKKLNPDKGRADILTAKDIMKDLNIKQRTFYNRLYNCENPIPMVKEGGILKIRRDKYEAWKQEMGL